MQACIDELHGKPVFVLATANNIDKLTDSLLCSGRFDKLIEVDVPDEAYSAGEYRNIIDWIANSDEVPFPPGNDRRSILSALPFEFCPENWFEYGNFWK